MESCCFDRHFPESVRSCAAMGADLVIIPTVNLTEEPMELFEQEIRVLSMQNRVFIAMCNRVGCEDAIEFAGESLITHPGGDVIIKADAQEGILSADIDLAESGEWKSVIPSWTCDGRRCTGKEEYQRMKSRIDLLETLAEAEEDVKNGIIAQMKDTFDNLRELLQED
ncbi:MAG: carbon-nitrogen hydrolase family protein [Eubacterium sp.]